MLTMMARACQGLPGSIVHLYMHRHFLDLNQIQKMLVMLDPVTAVSKDPYISNNQPSFY